MIQNNVIKGNYTPGHDGGGLSWCNGTIQNNIISGNWADWGGGGLYCCRATIQNNVISGNVAGAFGGGGLYDCYGTIQNNVITSNVAGYNGNLASGGGLCGCNGAIRNNTIVGNAATDSGGGLSGCAGTIVNSIIWGNTAPASSQISGCSTPTYSCIQGYTVGGQGNTGLNPRFVGPNDFHLRPDSPCIDVGTSANMPLTDRDGNPRPYDGDGDGQAVCDMGAYEYIGPPWRASVPVRTWMLYK
jgi:hypothetical protein